ncbi:RNA polymerase sigma factor [Sinomicrobium weinanense]|uniref:Sigma-70 family RNA polymerase sigma factor n=1 Tax=Sinomicrobium weinanense TaxID=2842200 RepID=A0A926JUS4_9FLAO|nr:sigma-70 family RNA polymerase sigma factor [Sinomicrobium weinanense]MBC9797855.1 sigma-70 family RNA polymerase sigma factor [Sinomicrobium weinanense]MBU3122245.1 sigma-70 family RNA polymerase sigma factor [Sinomicrobium weinanense]
MSKKIQEREFNEFYNRFYTELVRYAYNICFNKAVSEDIVQEVFIRIWKNADKDKIEIGPSLKPYLYTAVKNGCIDFFRSHGIVDELGFLDFYAEITPHYNPAAIADDEEEKKGMFAAILKIADGFPPQMQKVFRLWLCDNFKQTEIAKKLNIHPSTVNSHLKMAQEKICQAFAQRSRKK